MKKYTLLTILIILILTITACGGAADTTEGGNTDTTTDVTTTEGGSTESGSTDETPDGNAFTEGSAEAMLETLMSGLETGLEPLMTEKVNLRDKNTFQYHFFVPLTSAVTEGAFCQPIIGSVPFFVGILKVNTAEEAKDLAEDILDNVNYRKLICADFKKAHTRAVGNTVVLIMDIDPARADSVVARFDSLAAK